MAVQTQIQTRRGTAASWTSTNPTLAAGEIGFETDTGKFKIGNGSTAWASLAYSAGATAVTYLFNATGGQTTFSGADANGLTLAYTVGAEQVYLNGVLQVRGSDYTATNGTSIVLASGALVSDVLNVIAYSAMTITDTYTQAQSDARFVQQSNNFFAGKNKIINGDFGIWQRGTSFNITTGYTADRWLFDRGGSSVTPTISQQTFTPGTAPVAGYEGSFFYRYAQATAGTGQSYNSVAIQKIEDVRNFAGQTMTVSAWIKTDAARSFTFQIVRDYGSGGSGLEVTNTSSTLTTTTGWVRYSATFNIASLSGKTIGSGSSIWLAISSSVLNTAQTWDIWGAQAEAGSIATPFQTATGTIQGELAACQRYYWRSNQYTNNGTSVGGGFVYSSTGFYPIINLPVTMRPITSVDYSTLLIEDWNGTPYTVTNVQLNQINANVVRVTCTASGMTSQRYAYLQTTGSTPSASYIGFSAEL